MTDTSATRLVQSHPTPADSTPPPQAPVAETAPLAAGPVGRSPLRRTRTSATWIGVIVFTAVLVLLLIFILQNTQSVQISYFGATGHVSLAVAMLLAAVAGVLLTAIAGSLRIWQLRRRLRGVTRR
ncbi:MULTISPECIES: lipopolysaccharide assembly protein LapA domain-containing protein [Amycolatopsis]|uniref:Uncharacterized integral membrane protein n=2 Tax=Amycolatopsis TaxID=1813 RepID=A0A1I4AH87_9PSEU|nr:lipopolysaccharide assembly protein LapA domain-containing protein [Amycolatopsis sacchari]SFK55530.1 Uncharacterized integral membrane protein [Amycolatopsis sacchari]